MLRNGDACYAESLIFPLPEERITALHEYAGVGACPSVDTLLAYVEASLSAAIRDEIDAHVDGCTECRELVVHAIREHGSELRSAPSEAGNATPSLSMSVWSSLALPDRVGRYVLLERIGIGGMGIVCAAYDPRLQRTVAVKLVRRDRRTPEDAARLRREAQALASLSHPNVVTVFECGTLDDREGIYIVMEMVTGETLRRWCERATRSRPEILRAYLAAAAGLHAAHAAGLVHRDFKADNVLVDTEVDRASAIGRVRVTDFGLARSISANTDATLASSESSSAAPGTSDFAGTPSYMAPEQNQGDVVGPAADQYAWCTSLWEALAGALPPAGDRRIPRRVRNILRRGLSVTPEDRWPSVEALADAIQRRLPWTSLAIVGAGAVMLAALAMPRSLAVGAADPSCAVARHAIDRVWTRDRRESIVAFATSSAVGDIVGPLDAWVARWRSHADAACVADPALLRDDGCLVLATVELDTVLGVLERAPAIDVRLRTDVLDFAAADGCRASSRTTVAADSEPVAAVHAKLAQAAALMAMHRFDGARSLSAAAVADAAALGDALRAVALQRHAEVLHAAGDYSAEAEAAEQAFLLAQSAGLDSIAAAVATRRVFTCSRIDRDFSRAATWARHADAVIERMEPQQRELAKVRLVEARGHISLGLGRNDEAATQFAAVIEALHERPDIGASELAGLYNDYGTAMMQRDPDAALASFERALAIMRDHYGELHPRVAMLLNNIAAVHYGRDQFALAARYFADAAALLERLLGDQHHDVAGAYLNLGLVQDDLGDEAAARASIAKAIAIFRVALGPDHPEVGVARVNLGALDLRTGDVDAAAAEFEAALAVFHASVGDDHTYCTNALRGLAEVALARDSPARAAELQARALAIDRKDGLGPLELASAQLGLADTLHQAGDGGAAAQVVRDAIASIEAEPDAEGTDARRTQLAELSAWLRDHPL